MDPKSVHLPVYCYLPPSALDQVPSPPAISEFISELYTLISQRFEASPGQLVGKALVPPYTAFLAVAAELGKMGVETKVDMTALVGGRERVSEEELDRKKQSVGLQGDLKLDYGNASDSREGGEYQAGDRLNLVLIPDHPAFGEKKRAGAQSIELPLLAANDLVLKFIQKRWMSVSVPSDLGRYDVDEIQLKLSHQMHAALPRIAEFACYHIAKASENREVEEKLKAIHSQIRTTLPQPLNTPPVDQPQGGELEIGRQLLDLTERLNACNSQLQSASTRCSDLLSDLQSPSQSQVCLEIRYNASSRPEVVIVNRLSVPISRDVVEVRNEFGRVIEEINVGVVQPGNAEVVLNEDMVYRRVGHGAKTIVMRRNGQVLGLTNIV